jgi:hypothetical protein
VLLAGLLVLGLTQGPGSAAGEKPRPSEDPFYSYTGDKPLRDIKPGTILKRRTEMVSLGTNPTPIPALQVLYRTTDERHQPAITVTTILTPNDAAAPPRIVAYLSFYDALGSQCDPSYTLTGGDPGPANRQQAEVEEGLISAYLQAGATVEIPDFENTKLHWGAGQESGYSTLDSLRATEDALHLARKTTPVALTGYSGGSIAAEWASELAPHYAPQIDLVGVAAGGVPVHFAHNLHYVNGSDVWSGVIPAVLVSDGRAFGVRLHHYLSAKGRRITHEVRHQCIGSFSGAYPGLTIQSLLKPRYRQVLKQRVFVRIINHLIMGSTRGHPHVPLYLEVGNGDGTGDGIMVAGDVQALAYEYCKQDVPVRFQMVDGQDHSGAAVPFEQRALSFVQDRLDGVPFQGDKCSDIGKGNSLEPVPMPPR